MLLRSRVRLSMEGTGTLLGKTNRRQEVIGTTDMDLLVQRVVHPPLHGLSIPESSLVIVLLNLLAEPFQFFSGQQRGGSLILVSPVDQTGDTLRVIAVDDLQVTGMTVAGDRLNFSFAFPLGQERDDLQPSSLHRARTVLIRLPQLLSGVVRLERQTGVTDILQFRFWGRKVRA